MKTGRPKLKHGLAKSVQLGVRFTPEEYKTIRAVSKLQGFSSARVSAWVRWVALTYASLAPSTGKPFGTFEIVKTKKKPPKEYVGFAHERIPGEIRCPSCDGVHFRLIPRPNGAKTNRCLACGLKWVFSKAKTD